MSAAAFFDKLGRAIQAEWAETFFDERLFPELAERHLLALLPSNHVTAADVVSYALFDRDRGQGAKEANNMFGEPNITVFSAQKFFIEALFWLDGSTTIHQHAFSGAFHVLAGGSIHSRYQFETTRVFNDTFKVGRLSLVEAEWLQKGSVRRIARGPALTHSLFHLDYPSVSIVVRTHHDGGAEAQFDYSYPSLARDPTRAGDFAKLARRTIEMLRKSKSDQLVVNATRYLASCEPREVFELLLHEVRWPEHEWVFEVLSRVVEAQPRLREVEPFIRECLEEEARVVTMLRLRATVTETDLRRVIGVLLNARNRQTAFHLLGQLATSGDDPPIQILIKALKRLGTMGIGLPVDDSTIDLVEALLTGASDDEVVAGYDADSEATIREACAILRTHPLLTSVLS